MTFIRLLNIPPKAASNTTMIEKNPLERRGCWRESERKFLAEALFVGWSGNPWYISTSSYLCRIAGLWEHQCRIASFQRSLFVLRKPHPRRAWRRYLSNNSIRRIRVVSTLERNEEYSAHKNHCLHQDSPLPRNPGLHLSHNKAIVMVLVCLPLLAPLQVCNRSYGKRDDWVSKSVLP